MKTSDEDQRIAGGCSVKKEEITKFELASRTAS
jgi:hypothetical protein